MWRSHGSCWSVPSWETWRAKKQSGLVATGGTRGRRQSPVRPEQGISHGSRRARGGQAFSLLCPRLSSLHICSECGSAMKGGGGARGRRRHAHPPPGPPSWYSTPRIQQWVRSFLPTSLSSLLSLVASPLCPYPPPRPDFLTKHSIATFPFIYPSRLLSHCY